MGSALAYRSIPLQAAYCGAKAAARGFTDSLRVELMHERSGVRVTTVHLPAINTPQFECVRTRMSRRPRPVAPVYQPEVAARAVLHAADHGGRERWVGGGAVGAIVGERLAPGLLDRYLAWAGRRRPAGRRAGHPGAPSARQPRRPLPGDRGACGRFGDEAASRSLTALARERLGPAGAAGVAGVGLLAAAVAARRRS